ncbi:MAG: glycosyltransferase [Brevinematia bacterium]
MKFLIIPENNSLSHIAKALSIRKSLIKRNHSAEIAISRKHSPFLDSMNIPYHILPDIQESDGNGFPSYKWFADSEQVIRCVREEVNLIDKYKPDKVIGIFRFTLYFSVQLANIPYYSLICGCMVPEAKETLGFTGTEKDCDVQRLFLNNFFLFSARKIGQVLSPLNIKPVEDIRYALKGEKTFLWDFPEFMPIEMNKRMYYVGPILFDEWPYDRVNIESIINKKESLALISFGSCVSHKRVIERISRILTDSGYKVIIAAGGQEHLLDIGNNNPMIKVLRFAPMGKILSHTSVVITHGGQMTIFEALKHRVPVVVMPLQPEQAHNGVCLERIGCGIRLIPSTVFSGLSEDYVSAFDSLSDNEIKDKIFSLIESKETKENLKK